MSRCSILLTHPCARVVLSINLGWNLGPQKFLVGCRIDFYPRFHKNRWSKATLQSLQHVYWLGKGQALRISPTFFMAAGTKGNSPANESQLHQGTAGLYRSWGADLCSPFCHTNWSFCRFEYCTKFKYFSSEKMMVLPASSCFMLYKVEKSCILTFLARMMMTPGVTLAIQILVHQPAHAAPGCVELLCQSHWWFCLGALSTDFFHLAHKLWCSHWLEVVSGSTSPFSGLTVFDPANDEVGGASDVLYLLGSLFPQCKRSKSMFQFACSMTNIWRLFL